MKKHLPKLSFSIPIAFLIFFFSIASAQTQDLSQYKTDATGFYENKGQIMDQNHKPNPAVKYLLFSPGFNVQLRQTGFSYDTYTDEVDSSTNNAIQPRIPLNGKFGNELPKPFTRHYHRVDIELLGCNGHAQITTEGKSDAYYNYISAAASYVHYYQKVVYKDIYPNIDLEFFTSVAKNTRIPLEYQFIVHPGGKPGDIKLDYKGANKVSLINNKLIVNVAAGDFTENIPASYLKDNMQPVKVTYIALDDNVFTFSLTKDVKLKSDLVIDPGPCLDWGTYYGSRFTRAYGISVDASDNIYITGVTNCASNIATSGTYQTTYSGINENDEDAFVAKFDSTGSSLLWGTYYGGNGQTWGTGIALDTSGNIYITGFTYSTSGIATTGAFQTTYSGGSNGFIAKFNAIGTDLLWGTYFCEVFFSSPIGIALALDKRNNIYVALGTPNTGLATPGAYQSTNDGTCIYIARLNSSGSAVLYGTYYGGHEPAPYFIGGIALDSVDNVFIGGSIYVGANQFDGYIAKFDSTLSSLFWGEDGGNAGFGRNALDKKDNMYITMDYNGENFVNKYNYSGNLLWSNPSGGAAGITVDGKSDVYITGETTGNNAFVTEFNTTGTLLWSTNYGNAFTSGFNIALNRNNNIYITGQTQSSSGIATAGAYQTTLSDTVDAFVAKFLNGAPPTMSITENSPCETSTTDALTGIPSGGIFSGAAVTGSNFNPEMAGVGSHTLYYYVGCLYDSVIVNVNPSANWSFTANGLVVSYTMGTPSCPGSFLWDFGNGNFDSVAENPTVTYLSGGTFTACLECEGSPHQCVQCINITLPGHYSGSTNAGINNIEDNGSINLYPNPSNGQFTINLTGNQNGYTVEIYNIMGGKVYQSVLANSQNTINLSSQPDGMYFVYLKSEEDVEVGKVLVTR